MKSLFRFAGVLTCLCAAQAHESWAPHTHALDQQHSDGFVASVGVVAAGVGLMLFALFRKRFKSELSNSPDQRLIRRSRSVLSPLDDRAN